MRAKIAILLTAAALAGCAGGKPTFEAALATMPFDSFPPYAEVTAHETVYMSGEPSYTSDLLIRRDSAGYEYDEERCQNKDTTLTLFTFRKPSGNMRSLDKDKKPAEEMAFLDMFSNRSKYGAPEDYLEPVLEGGLWRFSPKDSEMTIDISLANGEVTDKSKLPKPVIYFSAKSGRVEKVVEKMDMMGMTMMATMEFVWDPASAWPVSVTQRADVVRPDGESRNVGDSRFEKIQVKAVEPFSAESFARERCPGLFPAAKPPVAPAQSAAQEEQPAAEQAEAPTEPAAEPAAAPEAETAE